MVLSKKEDADIAEVLFSAESIRSRVTELGALISTDFSDGQPLTVVGVATGAFIFLADLVRAIDVPMEVDVIRAESYGQGTESSGQVRVSSNMKVQVEGRHVLLVEDILDTGRTLAALVGHMVVKGANSVSVCVLLDKEERRIIPLVLPPSGKQYTGFQCPDQFVVGYGLDFDEKYRSLSYVGVLRSELYSS